ncbi:MAG: hypothetical protein JST54_32905 [Deltaproteobacteria bacterium]|nr:hypothetical protein [Deltaproteobacteria bacterium]
MSRTFSGFFYVVAAALILSACGEGSLGQSTAITQPDKPAAGSKSLIHAMPMTNNSKQALGGSAQLTYYGGPVISNVRVYTVVWGSGVNYMSKIDSFYSTITQSAYFDWLSEYNTPSQTIGRGSFAGEVDDANPPSGNTIDDSQIQAEVDRLINAGQLPPNSDGNNLYMFYFPPGITITQGGQQSCQAFCAYHGTYSRNGQYTYYGVVPDLGGACAGGCGGGSQDDNTTAVSSHEMIEAVTDAAVGLATGNSSPLAWYDQNNGEIGDICNGQQGQVAGFTVQLEWSNSHNACIAAAPGAGTTGSGTGSTTGDTGSTTGGTSGGTTTGSTGSSGSSGSSPGAICASCSSNSDCATGFCNTFSGSAGFCDSANSCQSDADCGPYACDTNSGDCVCN